MAEHDHQITMTTYLTELVQNGGGVVAKPCADCGTVLYVSYIPGNLSEMREIGGGREPADD